jgi:hypothetical protein
MLKVSVAFIIVAGNLKLSIVSGLISKPSATSPRTGIGKLITILLWRMYWLAKPVTLNSVLVPRESTGGFHEPLFLNRRPKS